MSFIRHYADIVYAATSRQPMSADITPRRERADCRRADAAEESAIIFTRATPSRHLPFTSRFHAIEADADAEPRALLRRCRDARDAAAKELPPSLRASAAAAEADTRGHTPTRRAAAPPRPPRQRAAAAMPPPPPLRRLYEDVISPSAATRRAPSRAHRRRDESKAERRAPPRADEASAADDERRRRCRRRRAASHAAER